MQHPDEGTIHAWLDGALSAEEARALEAHIATCAPCAAAASEARGLLAASSRILSALDSVPGGVLPAAAAGLEERNARTVRHSPLWRSPGWRAAAAILVVGTVSWLATRPGGPATVATERAMSTSPAVGARSGPLNDTLRESIVAQAPPAEPTRPAAGAQPRAAAPHPEPGLARVQRNVAPREGSAAVAAPPAAQAFAAAPTRDSAVRSAAIDTTSGQSSGAAADAMERRAAAGAVARMGAEQRLAAPSPSAMMGGAMAPMAKAIAPASATDAAARLAGCYALEAAWTESAERGHAAAALLPPRVELTRDRAGSANPSMLVLRPAPGEPVFAAGTRGEWKVLGGNLVELQIRDATDRVSAIIAIAGDSLSGDARAYAGEATVPLVTAVKGQRITCPLR